MLETVFFPSLFLSPFPSTCSKPPPKKLPKPVKKKEGREKVSKHVSPSPPLAPSPSSPPPLATPPLASPPLATPPLLSPPPPPPPPPPPAQPEEKEEEPEVFQPPPLPRVNGPIPSSDPHIITIQSTSSDKPLNIRSLTSDEIEIELHHDIKIQKVAHTRWTPPKKPKEPPQQLQTVSNSIGGSLPSVLEESHPLEDNRLSQPEWQRSQVRAPTPTVCVCLSSLSVRLSFWITPASHTCTPHTHHTHTPTINLHTCIYVHSNNYVHGMYYLIKSRTINFNQVSFV